MAQPIEPRKRSASKLPVILIICAVAVLTVTLIISPENFGMAYFQCGVFQGCDGPRSFIAYFLEPSLGYDTGIEVAHMLDITPFVITVGFLAFAWIAKRRDGRSGEAEESKEVLDALSRCDGCKAKFPNYALLTKVEGRGYLCGKCRSTLS